MSLAFKLARRELRGGVRGLWIVVLCLALGVGVIAAVGSLQAAVEAGLSADGRALLGGDLEVDTGPEPAPAALPTWLAGQGARTSEIAQMRSMLVVPSGQRQLIELKAVDDSWPLVGTAGTDPPQTLPAAFANHGLLVERLVLDRLGLKPGDTVRLGTASFHVSGVLTSEPDRVATAALLAPRVLVSARDLEFDRAARTRCDGATCDPADCAKPHWPEPRRDRGRPSGAVSEPWLACPRSA